jgi:hypothetical protein
MVQILGSLGSDKIIFLFLLIIDWTMTLHDNQTFKLGPKIKVKKSWILASICKTLAWHLPFQTTIARIPTSFAPVTSSNLTVVELPAQEKNRACNPI